MINYISSLPPDLRSGGFSARNAAACTALSKLEEVNYVGPISPAAIRWQKAVSKLLRVARLPGDFFFFSERRLKKIAHEVYCRSREDAQLDFFHGFTPWLLTRPPRPYIAWSDCTFHDYINVFHTRNQFRKPDLERIEQAEAAWLKDARLVIFESNWAAQRAIDHYGLGSERVRCVGNFGEVDPPSKDTYVAGNQFTFVSTNFEAKGGPIAVQALRAVRHSHPSASLIVVGDRPSRGFAEPGLKIVGFLRKEIPAEINRFHEILSQTRALVHPTSADTTSAIVVEAGYFGCPVIASRKFGIPESVDHQRTGLLLDDPSVSQVARAMNWMIENEGEYRQMRRAAWSKAHGLHSKHRFEDRLRALVRSVLDECSRVS